MSVICADPSGTGSARPGCSSAGIRPGSAGLGVPDVVVVVVVVLALSWLAATGRDVPPAMAVLVAAVAGVLPRRVVETHQGG